MTGILSLLGALCLLALVALIPYYFASKIAEAKGQTINWLFVICLFFNFFAVIYVMALPDLIARANQEKILRELQILRNGGQQTQTNYTSSTQNHYNDLPEL